MKETFFKYLKKRWWVLFLYLILVPALCIFVILCGMAAGADLVVTTTEIWVTLIIIFIIVSLCLSLPMLVITIPAAKDVGVEKEKSSVKCFFIYQSFIILASLLIAPAIIYLSLIM